MTVVSSIVMVLSLGLIWGGLIWALVRLIRHQNQENG